MIYGSWNCTKVCSPKNQKILYFSEALQAAIRCISSPTYTVIKGWSIGLYSTERLQNHHIDDIKVMSYGSFNDAKHFKLSQSILLYMFHAIFPLKFYWSFVDCKTNITNYPKIETHYLWWREGFERECNFLQLYIWPYFKKNVCIICDEHILRRTRVRSFIPRILALDSFLFTRLSSALVSKETGAINSSLSLLTSSGYMFSAFLWDNNWTSFDVVVMKT